MKRILSISLLLLLLSSAFAKDKPDTKPSLTSDQKIELLTAERDYLAAQLRALPYQIAAQQLSEAFTAKQVRMVKELGIDSSKWQLSPLSLEFSAAPPAPIGAAPVTPKPADKP